MPSPRGIRETFGRIAPLAFGALVVAVLYGGWRNRAESYLTAEEGTGYALGILGVSFMLLLLLYPARKRIRFMRHLGPVKYWFRAHMMLGVLGPVCILFHANFTPGSLNSNIALACMLLVAASGLVGRYFYTKIHHGLYGRRANLRDLLQDNEDSGGRLALLLDFAPELTGRLRAIETWAARPQRGVAHSMARVITLGIWGPWARLGLRLAAARALGREARRMQWSRARLRQQRRTARLYLADFFGTARKVVEFSFYERLFSMWHVLHLPLFLMMVIAGSVHVFAVHMY